MHFEILQDTILLTPTLLGANGAAILHVHFYFNYLFTVIQFILNLMFCRSCRYSVATEVDTLLNVCW